jgi:hypothetical protein
MVCNKVVVLSVFYIFVDENIFILCCLDRVPNIYFKLSGFWTQKFEFKNLKA